MAAAAALGCQRGQAIHLCRNICPRGLPWCSSGEDATLPLQGAQVRSLVRELRSCMPRGETKKKKKKSKASADHSRERKFREGKSGIKERGRDQRQFHNSTFLDGMIPGHPLLPSLLASLGPHFIPAPSEYLLFIPRDLTSKAQGQKSCFV